MNKWRMRHPNYVMARKPRNRADQTGTDSGSVDAELTDDVENMFDFAQRSRKEREARLHGGDVRKRAARTKKASSDN
jgi:hypothetical protein